jgi:hypothetical protein
MTHASLVALGVRWLSRQSSAVFYEFAASAKENPDIIGWSSGFSTLIECKATRADFLSDSKKVVRRNPRRGMGQRRYYLCPPGLSKSRNYRRNGDCCVPKRHASARSDSHRIETTLRMASRRESI